METIAVSRKAAFRKWLRANHKKATKVAVVLYKRHTGRPAPTHRELIEEAICFGWIDTTIKRLDEDRYVRRFARRTKQSSWSDNTLRYAKELVKAKRMTAEGVRFYRLGLNKPTHDSGIPKNPTMPSELMQALARDVKAKQNFDAFPPSTKKMLYRWLLRGKRPETRTSRAQRIVEGARHKNKDVISNGNSRHDETPSPPEDGSA